LKLKIVTATLIFSFIDKFMANKPTLKLKVSLKLNFQLQV